MRAAGHTLESPEFWCHGVSWRGLGSDLGVFVRSKYTSMMYVFVKLTTLEDLLDGQILDLLPITSWFEDAPVTYTVLIQLGRVPSTGTHTIS
jgi:hypothetical protein